MNLQQSYFAIKSPLAIIDRWLHPYQHAGTVQLVNKTVNIEWTKRAKNALQQQHNVLIAEMQLYFSCVVKKRVLFHNDIDIATVPLNDKLKLAFRAVESTSCSPEEFAQNYPVKQTFTSPAAMKLHPSVLQLDYIHGQWQGDFSI